MITDKRYSIDVIPTLSLLTGSGNLYIPRYYGSIIGKAYTLEDAENIIKKHREQLILRQR